ncbi:hypothetical protein VM1G_11368 [Cytospora mali]|uniref:Uncharacterized protein n=1 Tax=Cytospora mali TaxID=578113 RepID=A0A194VR25_CYTMA|nr:hypothetical protein VM1G_11368 [Valsa mali]
MNFYKACFAFLSLFMGFAAAAPAPEVARRITVLADYGIVAPLPTSTSEASA